MLKDNLHDFLFGDTALEQQSDRLGDRPPVFAQQTLLQQPQMLVPALVSGVFELHPDSILANLDGKCLQIVTFIVKTAAALEVEASAVPVTGENAVSYGAAGERIAHVGTLVVCCIDPSIDVEQ